MRVAVFGLGLAGGRLHLPALRRIPGVEIAVTCDPAPAAGAALTDWRAAMAVPADAVVIATPPATHAELAIAAAGAGRHIYLEKPVATSLEDALAVGDAVLRAGVRLQVGYAYRFHPLWQQARQAVEAGRIQLPLSARARFTSQRGDDPVLDLAGHHLDLIGWVAGETVSEASRSGARVTAVFTGGSRLDGTYEVGPPEDRVVLDDRVTVDRMRGWRGLAGLRLPVPILMRSRLGRAGWDISFERALAAFLQDRPGGCTFDEGLAVLRALLAVAP